MGPLIALSLHKALAHCGSNQLLYNIRRRFWIPLNRTLCKRTLKNCSTCRKANAVPYKYTSMGPLPTERATQSPPFSYTRVDFLGPITTKSSSGEDCKRYVALFACLVTRLVHLEVAVDLSAKNFISADKRFIARKEAAVYIQVIHSQRCRQRLDGRVDSEGDLREEVEGSIPGVEFLRS
ncbi:unnamed protein product [Heligmosomoides polygyrus]|uniref:Integrase zinc-binding domain-containing protein n=1 Tax=Heligmosomoides polygyrus TaxID=6339 RepID=A0A3P8G5P4_HELPZ|nr:unnamed protein product [Heligmosomoides polygyrus]